MKKLLELLRHVLSWPLFFLGAVLWFVGYWIFLLADAIKGGPYPDMELDGSDEHAKH